MTGTTIAIAVVFGVSAGILAMYAHRAGKGEIPFGVPTPLIGSELRKNAQTWESTHRRAAPYLWTAAVICLIQAIALAVLVAYPTLMTLGYLLALTLTGVVLTLGLLYLGGRQLR